MGVRGAAVHLVLLADAHLNFDLCAVGQRGHPRVGDDQRKLVVGFLQTVQNHDLRVCGCGRDGEKNKERFNEADGRWFCVCTVHLAACYFAKQN